MNDIQTQFRRMDIYNNPRSGDTWIGVRGIGGPFENPYGIGSIWGFGGSAGRFGIPSISSGASREGRGGEATGGATMSRRHKADILLAMYLFAIVMCLVITLEAWK